MRSPFLTLRFIVFGEPHPCHISDYTNPPCFLAITLYLNVLAFGFAIWEIVSLKHAGLSGALTIVFHSGTLSDRSIHSVRCSYVHHFQQCCCVALHLPVRAPEGLGMIIQIGLIHSVHQRSCRTCYPGGQDCSS